MTRAPRPRGRCGAKVASRPPPRRESPANLAAVFAETPIGRRYLALAQRAGAPPPPPDALGRMLAPFRADARPPTARRVLVAVGRDDRIALDEAALALAAAWGATARLYPRGHLTLLFACRALRRDLARFVAGAN